MSAPVRQPIHIGRTLPLLCLTGRDSKILLEQDVSICVACTKQGSRVLYVQLGLLLIVHAYLCNSLVPSGLNLQSTNLSAFKCYRSQIIG